MSQSDDSSIQDTVRTQARWKDTLGPQGDARFQNTRWSLVDIAREGTDEEAAKAMATLCQRYWYPLYAYIRRSGRNREEAEDLTQEFFSRFLIEKEILHKADRDKGRLRTLLLTILKRFLIKDWRANQAEKRGGGQSHVPINFDEGEERYGCDPADTSTPDQVFEKQWATTLLGRVMQSLREDFEARGLGERYEVLQEALWWNSNDSSYQQLGQKLDLSENAVKQAVSRMRRQYRKMLKDEIRRTLDADCPEETIDAELKHLIEVLRGG